MDDSGIVALFFERSEGAIGALSSKYGAVCISTAYNILENHEDAEECVSDAYLAVWNRIPPEKPSSLLSYVLRIVRNISIDRIRYNRAVKRQGNYQQCMDELQECVSGSDTPEEWYNAKEVAEFIDAFLAGLDRTNRLLFVRRYWYQDSFAELSRMTGLRQEAIRTRLFRLREQLQSFLLGQGVNV